jgi:putative glycerol-1-phosphate prenyltransferase
MAGEMLGMKAIYLEAGSGAANPVGIDMIEAIRAKISLPLIVGGGITSTELARDVYQAGADMIVVGSVVEKQPDVLGHFFALREELNR